MLKQKKLALDEQRKVEEEKDKARKSKLNVFLNKKVTDLDAINLEVSQKTPQQIALEREKKVEEEQLNSKKLIVS